MKPSMTLILAIVSMTLAIGCGRETPVTYTKSIPPDGVPPMPKRYAPPVDIKKAN